MKSCELDVLTVAMLLDLVEDIAQLHPILRHTLIEHLTLALREAK